MQDDPTPPTADGSLRFQCLTSNGLGDQKIVMVELKFEDIENWGEFTHGFYVNYKSRRLIYPWSSVIGPLTVTYNSEENREDTKQYWHKYHAEHADLSFDDRCRLCQQQQMHDDYAQQGIIVLGGDN